MIIAKNVKKERVFDTTQISIEKIGCNHPLFEEVVVLGTKNSKTLGHFPKGAFIEHAKKGNIFIASTVESTLLGYILFSIPASKGTIRITHLCIDDNYRRSGIAELLLDEIRNIFSLRLKGMVLSCRKDYIAANSFWKKYGFVAKNTVRSRSKKENYLTKWWYDFGNKDLFSWSNENSENIKALLDSNMIIKLRDNDENEQTGAKYLTADWLMGQVDYYYAQEFYNEIERDKDTERASKSRAFVTMFCEAKFKPNQRDEVFQSIKPLIPGDTENDISDKKQLSECIAGGIDHFITTDTNLLNSENVIFEKYGVHISTPTDFILMLDQINNRTNYFSKRMAGVDVQYCQLESKEISELVDTFH